MNYDVCTRPHWQSLKVYFVMHGDVHLYEAPTLGAVTTCMQFGFLVKVSHVEVTVSDY